MHLDFIYNLLVSCGISKTRVKWVRNYYSLLKIGDNICKVNCTNYWTADRYSESFIRLVINTFPLWVKTTNFVFKKIETDRTCPNRDSRFWLANMRKTVATPNKVKSTQHEITYLNVYETENSYTLFRANQQKDCIKFILWTQCDFSVNRSDWHISPGKKKRILRYELHSNYRSQKLNRAVISYHHLTSRINQVLLHKSRLKRYACTLVCIGPEQGSRGTLYVPWPSFLAEQVSRTENTPYMGYITNYELYKVPSSSTCPQLFPLSQGMAAWRAPVLRVSLLQHCPAMSQVHSIIPWHNAADWDE